MEYLVFLKVSLGLIGAITASLIIWSRNKSKGLKKPLETEDGYLVENDSDLETEVNFDDKILIESKNNLEIEINNDTEIISDLEQNTEYSRLPDPKGKPTTGPR